ncbi:MAG: bifunctional GTP diphosphokinase/guanosine-3',5'-bis pyrophosphate 3'-pyrophosphohydrolase [Gammaproteobacteria bacterium]|nr:bifunctional GTP diphosphokinase/guanosine-3',5'-bis pyrophosphate 3'-pyrophosphohydrolase [Gammaproteobacteria bacterium]
MLEDYLEPDQIAEVYRAYLFGAEAHDGQSRASGEPYIYHPVAVAQILAEMRMDTKSLIAALLHDVIEDTPTAKEQIIKLFGEEVAELVDGVSKLTNIEFESRIEAQAENFRKMILAMTRDIRVILVKLADRLHNMRTLGAMRPDKRRRIARETLEIYAPIANRLGMNRVRLELEELGFAALYPLRYRVIADRMKKSRGNRKEIVSKIESSITERIKQEGLGGQVIGREKHLYGIYNKMREKQVPFNEIMDVYAFRIIVESVDMCYRVLGVVHNLYKPVPGRFKDYIAIPKANGYQSLHTVLFSPYGVPIEVQIRTEDMHRVAEAGIAAHWLYKSGDESSNSAQARARQWLLDLLEIQQRAGNSMEFLENVKVDLFPDEVYVFTPKGMIMALPRGATAVDFAYAVHTDVGNQCVAVKIDRRLMPLRSELRNGQTVEIITAAGARPNPAWLNFVHTAKARANIRNFLKNLQHDEAVSLGQRLLNKSLEQYETDLQSLSEKSLWQVTESFNVKSFDRLLMDIGLGNRMPMQVARALIQGDEEKAGKEIRSSTSETKPLAIKGTEGTVVTYAKCCRPIPGDKILGFVTAGRGVVIHVEGCKNVADYRNKPEKWIDVEWEDNVAGEFPVELRLLVVNQRGVLATIAATISDLDANIENVVMDERDGQHSQLTFTVAVKNRKHLARIIKHLRSLPNVVRINRAQK